MQSLKLRSAIPQASRVPGRRAVRVMRIHACRCSSEEIETLTQEKSVQEKSGKTHLAVRVGTVLAAAQIALLPFTGVSYAALDTNTEQQGLAATVEGSDITNEDQTSVLDKLQNKILPEAKEMLTRVGKGEDGSYPSSIAKELETVDMEVNDLIQQANKGGDMSNIKSAASGIEQQINALKAIVGFD